MARSPSRSTRHQGHGAGWLVIFLLVAGILAVVVFLPAVPASLLAPPPMPEGLGPEPVVTLGVDHEVASRDPVVSARQLRDRPVDLAEAAPEEPEPDLRDLPARPEPEERFKDRIRGAEVLAEAEAAYRAYAWDEASTRARSILDLDVPPADRQRAEEIIAGTDNLRDLFARLDQKDELRRNIDTHPNLLLVRLKGADAAVLPVEDMNNRRPVTTDDPVAYLQGTLESAGEAPVLYTGDIAGMLKSGEVGEIRPADVAATIAERQRVLADKINRFQADPDLRNDALAWYEAARFAYQNRLDEQVTEFLDRALLLDPELATALREDRASAYYTEMVVAMNAGNRVGASGYMTQLVKHYDDTRVYQEARAFYDGKTEEALAARQAAREERERKLAAAAQAQMERARARADQEALARLQREEQERAQLASRAPATSDEAVGDEVGSGRLEATSKADGDEGKADEFFEQGLAIYNQAKEMGATKARDNKYDEAKGWFTKALNLYAALVEGGRGDLADRMTTCAQLRYACIKYKRAF